MMPRKSNALKEAVADAAVQETSAEKVPAKRGPKPKPAPAFDLKAAKKRYSELRKEINAVQKDYNKASDALVADLKKKHTELEVPLVTVKKEIAAAEKALDKLRENAAKLLTKIDGQRQKADAATAKEQKKLQDAKVKKDAAMAKEFAELEKVLGSTTE